MIATYIILVVKAAYSNEYVCPGDKIVLKSLDGEVLNGLL